MGEEFKNGPEEGSGSSSVRADCHARSWLEWRENSVSLVKVAFFFTLVISKILFLVSGIKTRSARFGNCGRESRKDRPSNN